MTFLERLKSIQKASDWSQERLASELGVSFATLNAWLNVRAQPRKKALLRIERLYLDIVGAETVDVTELVQTTKQAMKLKLQVARLVEDQELLDKLTLYLTYHTNTIEGSTMTLSDVQDVIFEHKVLSNRTAVEQTEARNHQAALLWVLEQVSGSKQQVINETFIKDIHLRLMNGIVTDAGQYRQHAVRIMGSRTTVANWIKVPTLMQALADDTDKDHDDLLLHMAQIHADFEQIHSFSDGNGRTGRLILLAMALRAGLVPPIVAKERKYAYYKYLELAQTTQDYAPLGLFLAQSMVFASELLDETE